MNLTLTSYVDLDMSIYNKIYFLGKLSYYMMSCYVLTFRKIMCYKNNCCMLIIKKQGQGIEKTIHACIKSEI